jgi:hypothetical protein
MKSKEDILNRLEDVEEVHKRHKRTYSIPRSDERKSLRPGQLVKLVFLAEEEADEGARAERMWVEVEGAAGGEYIGKLTNRPRYIKYVKQNDYVVFRAEHICAIYVERNDPNWIDPEKFVIVSRRILNEEAWPDFAIRKEPHSDEFSGWLVSVGDEKDTAEIDAEDYTPISAHDLMNKFPILDSVLGEPVGTQWRWDDEASEYKMAANARKSGESQ